MKMLLLAAALASCTDPAVTAPPMPSPTDQTSCDRSWNPYGALPVACDVGCVLPPVMVIHPGCKLAVNESDQPRVDCAATFWTGTGATGCCVEQDLGGSAKVELFYECP